MLIMKQGNSPETATASRVRAELRQEENAGRDAWGGKPGQPQGTVGHGRRHTAASKPVTAAQGPEGSSEPRQRGEGTASLSLSQLRRVRHQNRRERKTHTHTGTHQSEDSQSTLRLLRG